MFVALQRSTWPFWRSQSWKEDSWRRIALEGERQGGGNPRAAAYGSLKKLWNLVILIALPERSPVCYFPHAVAVMIHKMWCDDGLMVKST